MSQLEEDIEFISAHLKGFESSAFKSAMSVYSLDPANVFYFSMFSNTIREMLRIYLATESSDEEIMNCVWYKNYGYDEDAKITRRQRIAFLLAKYLNIVQIKNLYDIDIDEWINPLLTEITNLNKFTHVSSKLTPKNGEIFEVEMLAIVKAVKDFLYNRDDCREQYLGRLSERIEDLIQEEIFNSPLDEVDILATHYECPFFFVEKVKIIDINKHQFTVLAEGNLEVTHQIGSESDNNNDDGYRWDASYPCSAKVTIEIPQDDDEFDTDCFEVFGLFVDTPDYSE